MVIYAKTAVAIVEVERGAPFSFRDSSLEEVYASPNTRPDASPNLI